MHLTKSKRFHFFIYLQLEFVDDNASTSEDKQVTEDTEEIDEEEGTDGVSSEGEKPSGNESIEVLL